MAAAAVAVHGRPLPLRRVAAC
eukprot:COSAG01_NODE_20022_length_975_cov_4.940639_1_plen_21_part_10